MWLDAPRPVVYHLAWPSRGKPRRGFESEAAARAMPRFSEERTAMRDERRYSASPATRSGTRAAVTPGGNGASSQNA